jgi:iron complex outermembrane receptor protein
VLAVQIVAELSAKSFCRRADAQRLAVAVCASLPCIAAAGALDDSRANPRVDEIVTTGVRVRPISALPRSATVITAEDIALSPSANILDLLAREANLNLRSLFGSAKFGGVDIRGQGDTYSSNVIVLVDGVKINAADQSGADFSSLPLNQVERIEVIRGANAVRYGSGAVGGVINILTRQPEPGMALNANGRAGSYSTTETGVSASWAGDKLAIGASANWLDSDGYRDNGDLDTDDYSAQLRFTPASWIDLRLQGEWHDDDYGLPGPISKGEDPESTDFPFNGGETDDDRVRLVASLGNETTGVLRMHGGLQDRTNEYRVQSASDQTAQQERPDVIEQDDTLFEVQYDKSFSLFSLTHDLTLGLDLLQTDYSRDQYELNGDFQDSLQGDIRQTAWFVAGDFRITEKLTFSTGYRQDYFRNTGGTYIEDCAESDKTDFGIPTLTPVCLPDAPVFLQPNESGSNRQSWRNSAIEAGFVYNPTERTNLFISYAQSFRNPNADDLFDSDITNDGISDLEPQTSDHLDAGIRQQVGSDIEWGLALFYSATDDEILYSLNPENLLSTNLNADEEVERYGAEADLRWYAVSWLLLTTSLGYTHGRFDDSNNELPLVPEWTGSLGMQLQPVNDLTWSMTANYASRRRDGNDFSNTQNKLDDYIVVDTRLSYELNALTFYTGINNAFDKKYATSSYSGQFYPAPDRNYYAGFTYSVSKNND